MSDKCAKQQQPRTAPGVHGDGAGKALSRALKKTFDAHLNEPVPDKFREMLDRIREEESRKTRSSRKS